MQQKPIDKLVNPIQRFIQHEKSGGIALGLSVVIALILANSPWHTNFHHFFEQQIGIAFNNEIYINNSLHHWINDGLMAIFFFVVGLELKREMVAGELSNLRKAMLPIMAAIGGMVVPACIYLFFNNDPATHSGWGIPMATDIAFALGVLYLLGNKIPLSLKVFLTALAIVDDLGAVLVIALFYTSDISLINLGIGICFLIAMFIGNKMGVRSVIFYALLGIGGVWVAFLLSGVHATISAVLAAFTIPANVRIKEGVLVEKINQHTAKFQAIDPDNKVPTLSNQQLHILENMEKDMAYAIPPLQKLEHALHPFVTFIVIPVFALANAGVSLLDIDMASINSNNIALGVGLGLLLGKFIGVVGFTLLFIKLKMASWPAGMHIKNLMGVGLLAGIGFTMSLFVTELAFNDPTLKVQAKIGIFIASIISGIAGYAVLNSISKKD